MAREDFYLHKYIPEYNILEGSSSSNYKHTVEVRAKIKAKALIRDKNTIVCSKEFLIKHKSDKRGINNPMFGKKWTEERRKKITKPIYVYDSTTFDLLYYYRERVIARKKN